MVSWNLSKSCNVHRICLKFINDLQDHMPKITPNTKSMLNNVWHKKSSRSLWNKYNIKKAKEEQHRLVSKVKMYGNHNHIIKTVKNFFHNIIYLQIYPLLHSVVIFFHCLKILPLSRNKSTQNIPLHRIISTAHIIHIL